MKLGARHPIEILLFRHVLAVPAPPPSHPDCRTFPPVAELVERNVEKPAIGRLCPKVWTEERVAPAGNIHAAHGIGGDADR